MTRSSKLIGVAVFIVMVFVVIPFLIGVTGRKDFYYTLTSVALLSIGSAGVWLTFFIGACYFIVPLIATFDFSLKMKRGERSFEAYRVVFASSQFQDTFTYSVVAAICTIIIGVLIVVPTAYWVRLRVPHLRFTGSPDRVVKRAAVVPGSGASAIDAVAGRADVLLTGDVKFHEADRAAQLGLAIVDLPHEVAEGTAVERWADVLADALAEAGVAVPSATS